jgi:cytochrome c oxidase accessory protein FixG
MTSPSAPHGASLYEAHKKVYPRAVSGRFRRLKWVVMSLCLAFFYLMPLVRWHRGEGAPDQAILIDLAGRRVYLFGLEFWPQEIYFVTGVMVLAMLLLFLATALFGRVWCGYACPQTVWTDLFVMVERWVEGDRMERIRLDRGPWTLVKLRKKLVKHGIWLGIAMASGCAFVGWYADAPRLTVQLLTGTASMTDYGFVALLTSTTYLLGGIAREQVCNYMCPWPRIQSALLDEHSRVVSYQAWRGEPRGKASDPEAADCVDCLACVQVCPAGIDIRDGHQMQCIDCSLCVDACDSVMTKLGRETGLIRWESFTGQTQRAAGQPSEWRPVRPRTILYAVLLLAVAGAMLVGLTLRQPYRMAIQHDRQPLFVAISGSRLRNGYVVKLSNQTRRAETFILSVADRPEAALAIAGESETAAPQILLTADPDGQTVYHVTAALPQSSLEGGSDPMTFILRGPDHAEIRVTDRFFGPVAP